MLVPLRWGCALPSPNAPGKAPNHPPPPPPRAEVAPAAGQPVESFPLDFTAVEGNMDSFMAQVKSLAQSLYPCSAQQLNEDLRLHLLLNTSVTCNDGSPAGYLQALPGRRN